MQNLKKLLKQREELMDLVEITFFIPCLNEEKEVINTINKLVSTVTPLKISYEILIYNDGSTDNTQKLVEDYMRNHSDLFIRLINNRRRMGLGFNYISGAFVGVGKYYMMICGDNSEPPESILKILEKKGLADIIVPYFGNDDNRILFRRYMSKLFTVIVNLLNGYDVPYYNGTVLHLRENIMRWSPVSSGFAYQAELITILLDMKKTYVQVQVANNDRREGFTRAFYLLNVLSIFHSLLQVFFRRIRKIIWEM